LSRQLARREQTTQVRIARELIARCRSLNRSILELERELQERTTTIAPRLLALPGCGPLSAAKLLCEIGPIDRFRTDAQLARHAGVAPLDASSGKHRRHRLDRGGNRQLNCALHRIAITQGRVHAPARAYLERKQSEGKSRLRARDPCLTRQRLLQSPAPRADAASAPPAQGTAHDRVERWTYPRPSQCRTSARRFWPRHD